MAAGGSSVGAAGHMDFRMSVSPAKGSFWRAAPRVPMAPLPTAMAGGGSGAPVREGGDGARAGRIGSLFRFVNYLHRAGVLGEGETLDDLSVQRAVQRCAYIAGRLGAGLDYRFMLLDIGAFSTDVAVDLYRRACAGGGAEPFGGDSGASGAFLGIVRGRDAGWLEAATLAMDAVHRGETREEFVARAGGPDGTRGAEVAAEAYDRVAQCAGAGPP